ncbi:MAG: FliO/MopB family protein [Rhodospirillaceae bacterium]|nr:FliO/MopB family protein [Rhodospirillaceae bacterium]
MELSEYFRFVLALAFVLGLIGLLALVAKRYGPGMARTAMTKGRKKRLNIVEVMAIDGKRRAVIFRRDDVEHLVILGTNSETVIETGITPPPENAESNEQTKAEDKN